MELVKLLQHVHNILKKPSKQNTFGKMHKRAMFFTISAIVVLGLLMTYVAVNAPVTRDLTLTSQTDRLLAINQFVLNVEKDAQTAVYTVGFRSLIGMIQYVEFQGSYLPPVTSLIYGLFINGTLLNNSVYVLENSTLKDWFKSISNKSLSLGVDFNYSINKITVGQTSPWAVDFSINCSVTFNDNKTNASWSRIIYQKTQISLQGFLDPLYIVETGNQFVREINQTNYAGIYVISGNASNLKTHMQRGYYSAFDGAPNYLMRLAGNKSASMDGTGIESLVDKDALSFIMPVDNSKSNADYIYFSTSSPTVYSFANMPASFRLDNLSGGAQRHTQFYQLTS